jgi:hypothetical protein
MLADIPAGSAVYLDANIFVYHFVPHPCSVNHAVTCSRGCREVKLLESLPAEY